MTTICLEDAVYLFDNAKGKSREDQGPTDAELALRLYQQELESHASIVSDRRMTRSIASAVQADGPILTGTVTEEDRMARDRDMAQRLTNGAEIAFSEPKDRTTSTFIEDDELLDKLRALDRGRNRVVVLGG
ncbi:MAG: hypothetical protein M1819_004316 [Sarea resinae]|nr:MAG: hypothetical protein M1819_004316 [Sarea resinae]